MGATIPYPDKPANGQSPDATPILANLLALLAAINSFDGSQVQAKTITENALADAVNPRLRGSETLGNFVEVGGYTSSFSGLSWTMPNGIAYYSGYRSPFTGQTYTVGINADTYYSVTQAGVINTPSAVATGAARPALPANSQWLSCVHSNGTAITSIDDLRTLGALVTTQQAWQTPTLQNSWVAYDGGGAAGLYGTLQYYRDQEGVVHLRGLIKSGTATSGTVLSSLPVGYRPGQALAVATVSNDAFARVTLDTDGSIKAGAGCNTAWISFSNIRFRAEN